MFDSLKLIIERRLGKVIALDDLSLSDEYFVRVSAKHLQAALFFLKNDPDTRLTLLDQIVVIPGNILPWSKIEIATPTWQIMYQLRSLKLPYRVSLVVDVPPITEALPSIYPLFLGARWQEIDIKNTHGIDFESNERDLS